MYLNLLLNQLGSGKMSSYFSIFSKVFNFLTLCGKMSSYFFIFSIEKKFFGVEEEKKFTKNNEA